MSAQVIGYLRANYPEVNLEEIANEVGLSLDFLESTTNWISVGAFLNLIRCAVLKSKNPQLAYDVGASAVDGPNLNRALRVFAKSVSTVNAFKSLAHLSKYFNKVTEISVLSISNYEFVFRLTPNLEELDSSDGIDMREFATFVAENTRGVYEALPTAQGLPKAVASIELIDRVESIPVFELRVRLPQLRESPVQWRPLLLGIALGSLVSTMTVQLSYQSPWLAICYGIVTLSFVYVTTRLRQLRTSLNRHELERKSIFAFHEKVLSDSETKYAQLLTASEKLEQLSQSYRRFVPLEFLELLNAKTIFEVKPGSRQQHKLTVFFLDLRKSTELVTQKGNDEAFLILNQLNEALTTEIRQHRGLVDKFTGDGIMAVFNEGPRDALFAAEGCIAVCTNRFPWAQLSIGFAYGSVLLGAVGTDSDLRLTAQGEAVHLAARLEHMNRDFETQVLFDSRTRLLIEQELSTRVVRDLGSQTVKGFPQPIHIYSLKPAGHTSHTELSAQSKP